MNLKLLLVYIQLKAGNLEADQNSHDMFFVFMKSFAEDKNIVHVYCSKEIQNIVF